MIENYTPFGQPPINPNKTSGRNLFYLRIQKENGDFFSKELFEKHFKNYLTSIPCQQALEKAKLYLSEKVD